MNELIEQFIHEYRSALVEHLNSEGEKGLAVAHDLGRWAMSHGLGLLDVVQTHQNSARGLADNGGTDASADEFLLQSLAAFEFAQRGFWDAQERIKFEELLVARLRAVTGGAIAIMSRAAADERLVELVEQARAVVDAAHAAIELSVDDPQPHATATGSVDDFMRRTLRTVARTRSPVRIDSPSGGGHLVLCVPVVVDRASIHGALLVWGGRGFDATDEAALNQLATVGTIAWNNARVFEREHDISVTLQRSLLPETLPDIPGLSITARYVPSGPGSEVGGDWYDVIELAGDKVGLVMGDVMGHGIRAAAVMSQLRLATRAYTVEGYNPGEVIERVDRLLDRLDSSQYATAVYCVLDRSSGQIGIVNAGHPQPVLLDPTGEARFIAAGGSVPLGVGLHDRPYQEEPMAVRPGSMLLFYTDGLIENRSRTITEGISMLEAAVSGFSGSPEQLCDLVLSRVADPDPEDDVCLLAVHVR